MVGVVQGSMTILLSFSSQILRSRTPQQANWHGNRLSGSRFPHKHSDPINKSITLKDTIDYVLRFLGYGF